jgi:hypothetical protein
MKIPLLLSCAALLLAFSLHLRANDADGTSLTKTAFTNAPESSNPSDGEKAVIPPVRQQDPFWPIGYVPSNPTPVRVITPIDSTNEVATPLPLAPKEPNWDAARKQLKVQGISRVGIDKKTGRATFFAVINGRVVEEGSIVESLTSDFKYRWKVASIVEKNIKLNPLEVQSR